ncbi:MAG: DUF6132 family protein [Bacteroides sp.]
MLQNFIRKNKLYFIGAGVGAVAGFLYWKFIGCTTGTCPITASPINSVIYGAVLFSLVFSLFKKNKPKE